MFINGQLTPLDGAKLLDNNVTVKAMRRLVCRQAILLIATSEVVKVHLFVCSCKQTEEATLKRMAQITSRSSHMPQVRDPETDQKSTSTPCRRTNSISLAPDKHVQQAPWTTCRCISTTIFLIEQSCPPAAAPPASRRRPPRSRKSSTLPQTIRDTHTITRSMTLTASLRRRNPHLHPPAIKQPTLPRRRRATSLPTCTPTHEPAPLATPTLS